MKNHVVGNQVSQGIAVLKSIIVQRLDKYIETYDKFWSVGIQILGMNVVLIINKIWFECIGVKNPLSEVIRTAKIRLGL